MYATIDDIREIRELRISVANELKESEEEAEMLADAKLRPVDQDHDDDDQHEYDDDQHEDDDVQHEDDVYQHEDHDDQHEDDGAEIQNVCFLKAWVLHQSSKKASGYNQVFYTEQPPWPTSAFQKNNKCVGMFCNKDHWYIIGAGNAWLKEKKGLE